LPRPQNTNAWAPGSPKSNDRRNEAHHQLYSLRRSDLLLKITKFQVVNGALTAIGTFSGTYTDAAGNTQTVANQAASIPVSSVDPSCSILDLTLGPLHLDLLGLVVDLNQVHLTITADEGSGNLLGNLLCAVANLLNGGGALSSLLTTLTNDLNAILAAL
jgi:hypothetical protein